MWAINITPRQDAVFVSNSVLINHKTDWKRFYSFLSCRSNSCQTPQRKRCVWERKKEGLVAVSCSLSTRKCICHLYQSHGIMSRWSQGGRLKVTTLKHGIDPNTWQHPSLCFSGFLFSFFFLSFVAVTRIICCSFCFLFFLSLWYKRKPRRNNNNNITIDVFYIRGVIKDSSWRQIILFFLFCLFHRPRCEAETKGVVGARCALHIINQT